MKKQNLEDKFILGTSILLLSGIAFIQTEEFMHKISNLNYSKISQNLNLETINNLYQPKKIESFITYK